MMIDAVMFGALGFFVGCLLALMLAPPLWNRAVKLTTRKLEATMPLSLADIQADKDQLRAEFAIELRKVEVSLDKAKEKATRELIEANKRRVEIQMLNRDLANSKSQLQEHENANRVLQQTIKRRLPDLDTRLKAAKKALAELEQVNAELRNTVASQGDALKTARSTLHNQRADIDRLRATLESGSAAAMRGTSKSDGRFLAESQKLSAELSRAHEELERARIGAQENAMLRRELTRLSAQILTVARNQGAQPHMAVEVTQAFADYEPVERQAPEPSWMPHAANGGGRAPELDQFAMEPEEPVMQEPRAPEPMLRVVETPPQEEEEAEGDEAKSETSEPKGGLAKRFAERRAKRRTGAGGGKKGGSLSERLRSLVAEAPDSRS
jgi:hypothetical protein